MVLGNIGISVIIALESVSTVLNVGIKGEKQKLGMVFKMDFFWICPCGHENSYKGKKTTTANSDCSKCKKNQ